MPRYLVERSFDMGLDVPAGDEGARLCRGIVENNHRDEVTWLHSYVSADGKKVYDLCDGPSPEAVRHAARANQLPVDCITEVRILDPYFYRGATR